MHPVLFSAGGLEIRTYGFIVAIAFLTGFYLMYAEAKRRNLFPDRVLDIEFIMLIAGVLGSRALHVLANLGYYMERPVKILFLWEGGLAVHGGIIAGAAATWIYIRLKKLPEREMADLIIPYVALGQSIGRIGCFFNGCCYGAETSEPALGFVFQGESVYRLPAQLYASAALLVIFIILRSMSGRSPFPGFIFTLYLFLYGLERFMIDFFRGDLDRVFLSLTLTQAFSLGLMLASVFFYIWLSGKKAKNGKARIHGNG